ncbi:MAG: LysM peptidoglycan-binding domain-containing protein, partial [Chloroflexi bacterium]|nr:LysM peptidoglycan-binding domain-containing protein [Chloroflexota bacterium]
ATVNVTFMQIEEEGNYPGQNPTSGSTPGNKMRVVREGDTIDWIAHDEYGDPARWRHIAEANNLSNPMDLPAGQVLAIPPLP